MEFYVFHLIRMDWTVCVNVCVYVSVCMHRQPEAGIVVNEPKMKGTFVELISITIAMKHEETFVSRTKISI